MKYVFFLFSGFFMAIFLDAIYLHSANLGLVAISGEVFLAVISFVILDL